MTTQMNRNLAIHTGLTLALALAVWSPALAQSAEPAKAKKMTMEGKPMEHSKLMMEHCKSMMADMKTQDAELAALVATMNSATKESKVDLMAEIITKMTEQRTAMNAKMGQMHMDMMKHMHAGEGSMPHHPVKKDMEK
jgi:hypothetical protein